MALIKCPECMHEVSSVATSCPHCGYPIAESSTVVFHLTYVRPYYAPSGDIDVKIRKKGDEWPMWRGKVGSCETVKLKIQENTIIQIDYTYSNGLTIFTGSMIYPSLQREYITRLYGDRLSIDTYD